jgi:hypothetical protein
VPAAAEEGSTATFGTTGGTIPIAKLTAAELLPLLQQAIISTVSAH